MKRRHLLAFSLLAVAPFVGSLAAAPKATVDSDSDKFFINGKPPYEGRTGQVLPAGEDTLRIEVGPEFVIDDNAGGKIRQFPFLEYLDGKLFATFSQHADTYIEHPLDGMRVSEDGGATWPIYIQNLDFYLTSIVKLPDGRLLGVSYMTYWVDARHATCHYWISSDRGKNWAHDTGTVETPQDMVKGFGNWGGIVFHRNILVMPDGSLQGTMNGKYVGDAKYRVIWVKSVDQGATWSVVSTVANGPSNIPGHEAYCESGVIRVADGSLLVVMRVESFLPLYQSRSTDGGLTWSAPTTLPGVPPEETHSVDPELTLMANGTLVLSYGRPKTRILFSLDGSGRNWGNLTETFDHGTGYTGVREVAPNRLLVITENSVHKRINNGFHNLNLAPPKIVGKYIDVVRSAAAVAKPKPE